MCWKRLHYLPLLLALLVVSACPAEPVDLSGDRDVNVDDDVTDGANNGRSDVGNDFNPDPLPLSNCRFPEAPDLSPLQARSAFSSLQFDQPTYVTSARDGSDRLFVLEKGGVIYVFPNDETVREASVFMDVSDRVFSRQGNDERGLLGMAFDPNFANNGHFYLNYTATGNGSPTTVSRFTVRTGNPDEGDPGTEVEYLSFDQPFPNHNGGMLEFGPDGYLYIAVGDGGSAGDPLDHGQNLDSIYGTIVRIDVEGANSPGSYRIPPDNPFLGPGLDEVYAYGLRNVWRFSFDRQTGQLWAADVGQRRIEEVDLIVSGGNYGWRTMEGTECFDPGGDCEDPTFIPPMAEYDHSVGLSITGGYVYRGQRFPALVGAYIYGDFAQGQVFGLTLGDGEPDNPPGHATTGGAEVIQLAETGRKISSFGEDEAGEILFLDYSGGGLFTLQAVIGGEEQEPLPETLSATGCFADVATQTPDPGLVPYEVNAELWSDGTLKERYFVLPAGQKMGFTDTGAWDFPERTIFIKNFYLDEDAGRRIIETRFLVNDPDGWHGYSYQWNDTQTEAFLLNAAVEKTFTVTKDGGAEEQVWTYPSRAQCRACHTTASGGVLGGATGQMDRGVDWEGIEVNQVELFDALDLFGSTPPGPGARVAFPEPFGDAPLDDRARSYMHANCAHCHLPDGVATSNIDIRYGTPLSETESCRVEPQEGDLGVEGLLLIDPGNAQRSSMYRRMIVRDETSMPSLASAIVHQEGALLIGAWIDSLEGCDP